MKKKIIYLITKSNYGGAQRYVFDLASNIDRAQYDVAVALGAPNDGESAKGVLLQKLRDENIRTIVIPKLARDINLWHEFLVLLGLIKIFIKEKPDIVHVNSSKIGGLGSVAARISFVKRVIFTVHGFAWNEARPTYQKKLIRFFSWLSMVFAHEVIFVVSSDYKDAQSMPMIGKKLHLIYNGIAPMKTLGKENAREIIAQTLKEQGVEIPLGNTWIGSLTEFIKNKGVIFLLQAFEKLQQFGPLPPNAILVLVGGGEEREKMEKMAKNMGISNRVFFTGFIQNANQLLGAFDIFTISSLKEGLPYSMLEAGMSEVPIVATSVGEIPKVIDQGKTGLLVPAGDHEELARAIMAYISDINERVEIAKNFKQKIRNEFTIDRMLEETKRLY